MSEEMDLDIKEKLQAQQERYNDLRFSSSTSYWASELTVNGIIIALFSLEILETNDFLRFVAFGVISYCVLSIILILFNFKSVRDTYFELGKLQIEDFRNMSEEERDNFKMKGVTEFKLRAIREKTVDYLLIFELLILLSIIIYKAFFV
ncbi:MAG: hypothetical protein JJ958_13615 [Balneola sp.]|nr:hypothetical protein [Balneola sp.]